MSPKVLVAQVTGEGVDALLCIDLETKRVVDEAPELAFLRGYSAAAVHDCCAERGWRVRRVTDGCLQ